MKAFVQSRFTAVVFFGILLCSCVVLGGEAKSPRQLLADSGIKGGLVVYVGPVDAEQMAALRLGDSYVVQGLDRDGPRLAQTREDLRKKALLGPLTVIQQPDRYLPYADNVVNVLIIAGGHPVPPSEGTRVLAPQGAAFVRSEGGWTRHDKPRPKDIDEWTHFLHSPNNNAVANDTQVAPPHHIQWVAGPRWGRSHDHLSSMSAAVSASGRLFYIVDEGPIASVQEPSHWNLVARDAFSGVLLWKKKVGPWETQLRPFRSGPAELPRRLVAVGQRVYVTLGYGSPVTALDAATGETVRTYEGTENTHEILVHGGRLYLVISEPLSTEDAEDGKTSGKVIRRLSLWRDFYQRYVTQYPAKFLKCVDASSGETVWEKHDDDTKHAMALTLAVSDDRVFFENEEEILAMDAKNADVLWRAKRPVALRRYAWSTPTLVVKDGIVISADRSSEANLDTEGGDETELEWLVTANHLLTGGEMIAFSAESGKEIWRAPCHEGFNFPVEVFVARGKVWSGEFAWGKQPGITQVYDLKTGDVVEKRPPDQDRYTLGFGHHRCYRNKATTQYILQGRSGVEFVDMDSNQVIADHWIRGACQYGILPCNGLLYAPTHPCACYIEAKLNSFNALAPKRKTQTPDAQTEDTQQRLETGPAYDSLVRQTATRIRSTDWPTYRHNNQRSGATDVSLSNRLTPAWDKTIGESLTSVVVAENLVYVAEEDAHTIHALDVQDGAVQWRFTAGGRIDSPPTVCGGFAYFGSADGWIYCVRARDGVLAWRFRAAPGSQQIVSYNQLESVWPVHGNVLVHQAGSSAPVVYAAAGRSSFLDGGMYLYRLDARTGRQRSVQRITHRDPESGFEPQNTVRGTNMPGALPDVLSTDGSSVFMRHARFDMEGYPLPQDVDHLFSSVGFLDDTWWHRTYWQVGTQMGTGYGGWPRVGNQQVSGRLLVVQGDRVLGFGRKEYGITGSHVGLNSDYHLFSADKEPFRPKPTEQQKGKKPRQVPTQTRYHWSKPVPFFARAMLLAGDTLFVAGPGRVEDIDATKPTGDVHLWAVSAKDGEKQAEYRLDSAPVFDSLAVADGRLFFTTVAGRVVSYRAAR